MILNNFIFMNSRKIPIIFRNIIFKIYSYLIKIIHVFQYSSKQNIFQTVVIETHNYCNRACIYCPNSIYKKNFSTKDTNYLAIKLIKKILNNLEKINFKGSFALTGFNEPLFDFRIKEIITLIRKDFKKNKIFIYTNGDYLNENLYSFLNKYNVNLNITLHSIPKSPERFYFFNKIKKDKNVLIRSEIVKEILSTRGGLIKPKFKERRKFCIIPSLELNINYLGNVILCSDDYFGKNKFGNISNEDIFKIWNKKSFKKIRKDILNGKLPEICRKCLSLQD